MSNQEKQLYKSRVERHKEKMPWYIIENIFPATLYGYLIVYEMFLQWLISSRLVITDGQIVTEIHEIPLETLEDLPLKQVKKFKSHLKRQCIKTKAVIRTFSTLKSLFNYLTSNTEDDRGECYFYRNVMAKMKIHKKKIDAAVRAKEISEVIFYNNDDINFIKRM
ncbi:Tyrosine recombinase XerS (plasmid) [Bacillus thuringiensis]|nr:Tyrosine recombinase XerS [Bacillus thuringiensis]